MDANSTIQLLQKGFHLSLGATASLLESLQDPQKREENLAQLRLDFSQLSQIWEEKGELTEAEARNFVETILSQTRQAAPPTPSYAPEAPQASQEVALTLTNLQLELQELTSQLAALRLELARERPESGT